MRMGGTGDPMIEVTCQTTVFYYNLPASRDPQILGRGRRPGGRRSVNPKPMTWKKVVYVI